ncbi:MAG: methyltransferase domain-containing protein [SAR202 cluster bacterium]|nr:methyltransferase domain-containing protein [SAR202 cluster bacterium]
MDTKTIPQRDVTDPRFDLLRHRFWRTLWREVGLRDKTLGRTFTNIWASQVTLAGHGVDLGAKDARSSHFRFFQQLDAHIAFTDLLPQDSNVVRLDLEQPFPLDDRSQDFLLLMHVLEHVYADEKCLAECHRVLKPGGRLIGAVPFLHHVHPDPDDYFRFTASGLGRRLVDAGFQQPVVDPLGFGPMTAASHLAQGLLPLGALRFIAAAGAITVDRLVRRLGQGKQMGAYPLAYGFVATKA